MDLQQWYAKGLTSEQYKEKLDALREGFLNIYHRFEIDETPLLNGKNIRALVLAEPWCGHSMLNIPILLRIAEREQFDVRFLLRDENLDLMDQYLTNGRSRSIPIFIFIDEFGEEIGKWGPMSKSIHAFMERIKETLPPKDAADYDEQFGHRVRYTKKTFAQDESLWDGPYESMMETLKTI